MVAGRTGRCPARRVSVLGAARRVARRRFLAADTGAFFGGASIIALQNLAMYPLLFQLPVFFDRVRGLGARPMGQALLALTLAMMVSSVVGGRLAERIGARTQTLVGSLVALAGLYWFADFESVHAPSDVMPGMLLMGAGVGMTSPPAQAASMKLSDAISREWPAGSCRR